MRVKGRTTGALAPCQRKEPVYFPMLTRRSGGHRDEQWPSKSLWQPPNPHVNRVFDRAGREAGRQYVLELGSQGSGFNSDPLSLRVSTCEQDTVPSLGVDVSITYKTPAERAHPANAKLPTHPPS